MRLLPHHFLIIGKGPARNGLKGNVIMNPSKAVAIHGAFRALATTVGLAGLIAASAPRVLAAPLVFGSNHYLFVPVPQPFTGNNNSWDTAKAAAAASVFNSVNGHLATVTSQAENDFLFSLVAGTFSGFNGAWLGGKSPEGWLTGPETGQSFTYTSWGGSRTQQRGLRLHEYWHRFRRNSSRPMGR